MSPGSFMWVPATGLTPHLPGRSGLLSTFLGKQRLFGYPGGGGSESGLTVSPRAPGSQYCLTTPCKLALAKGRLCLLSTYCLGPSSVLCSSSLTNPGMALFQAGALRAVALPKVAW